MGCDDLHMPLAERMSEAGDLSDLDALHLTERHLLYVACTRARDFLLVTGVDPVSDFLADLVSAS
jgi:ATP-dependent exoDNAse (exonuclease V) beta subunit